MSYFSCATAYVLLAEEEATTIVDAEKYFKQALKAGEMIYRKSQNCHSQSPQHEAQLSKDFESHELLGLCEQKCKTKALIGEVRTETDGTIFFLSL